MKTLAIKASAVFYQVALKHLFFLFNPEKVHHRTTILGERLGTRPVWQKITQTIFKRPHPQLEQELLGIHFASPVGLAAGYDYEARLTQLLSSLDFGFQTIGTITNLPYEGNTPPRLGRLPKSRSLMVNKGFKNDGVRSVVEKLGKTQFTGPVGISLGQSNLPEIDTIDKALVDIRSAFEIVEKSGVPFSYYELNISCPNLHADFSFYAPTSLDLLLNVVKNTQPSKPILIKMPINVTDEEALGMLRVIAANNIAGIIFGNLQKDRTHPSLVQSEVQRFKEGNFSGKLTEQRSTELVSLAYKHYGGKLLIVGCGGVFNAEDAYQKIRAGASLVQLITGMIFQGPQIAAEINLGLEKLLKKDGFKRLGEAIGADHPR